MKLAVIVPVYNMEKYLEKCIDSIRNQDIDNFEIILVDDGSTDSSGEMCDKFACEDDRITVYHKPNGGLMSTWKYGLTHTAADYVGFVDSDDWIDNNMYSTMLKEMESCGADIVSGGFIQEYEDGRKIAYSEAHLQGGIYNKQRITDEIYPILLSGRDYHTRGFSVNRWNKLFKRETLLQALPYCDDEISIGDDMVATFSAIHFSETICILDDFYPYHYRIQPSSIMHSFSDSNYDKINILRQGMLRANEDYDYDFSLQINTDYIKLVLMQMERNIVFGETNIFELAGHLKEKYKSEDFSDAYNASEVKKLPLKYRGYLFLLKFHLYYLMILVRRLKALD